MSANDGAELVDDLYRRAIETPHAIDDASLADWMEAALEAVGYDRGQAKALRAAVRHARKLALRFAAGRGSLPDWRNGVDDVLGAKGWEPQLDLVRARLAESPDPELFAATKYRHRAVHFTEWMEGMTFEEWRERQG